MEPITNVKSVGQLHRILNIAMESRSVNDEKEKDGTDETIRIKVNNVT